MILNVYNIRDERQGTYGTPIYTDKDSDQLTNDYSMTVESMQANIERLMDFAPEKGAELALRCSSLKDCVLYKVGTFDNKTGAFQPCKEELVLRVSDCFREVSRHA